MSLFSCLAWLKATVDITDGTRTRIEAFTSVSTLPAAAEDASEPRAQALGASRPRGGGGAFVRVGVVQRPDVVVDGRRDLDWVTQ